MNENPPQITPASLSHQRWYDTQQRALAEFDEKFGKGGPELNTDSIGRKAGCDDCFYNCKLREEYRVFMLEVLTRTRQKVIEEIIERVPMEVGIPIMSAYLKDYERGLSIGRVAGHNDYRTALLATLKEMQDSNTKDI